jgi:hypothetical protein
MLTKQQPLSAKVGTKFVKAAVVLTSSVCSLYKATEFVLILGGKNMLQFQRNYFINIFNVPISTIDSDSCNISSGLVLNPRTPLRTPCTLNISLSGDVADLKILNF